MFLFVVPNLQAQTNDFNAFRNRMLNDFQDFRKGVMERYVEFLDAAWAEYETMTGRRRVTTPKPVVAPVYTPPENPVAEEPVEPIVVEPEEPTMPKPEQPTEPSTPKGPTTPTTPKVPQIPSVPTPDIPQIRFALYGLSLAVPAPKLEAASIGNTQQEVVGFWKQILP